MDFEQDINKGYVLVKFSSRSWIYLSKAERRTLKKVLMALSEYGALIVENLREITRISDASLSRCLWILVALRILEVRQKKIYRQFFIKKNWEERLNKKLIFGVRGEYNA